VPLIGARHRGPGMQARFGSVRLEVNAPQFGSRLCWSVRPERAAIVNPLSEVIGAHKIDRLLGAILSKISRLKRR
jgi:hypothetical protein